MDNHVMVFCDEKGELELTRCRLCKNMQSGRGRLNCKRGNDCNKSTCEEYRGLERHQVRDRLALLRQILHAEKQEAADKNIGCDDGSA